MTVSTAGSAACDGAMRTADARRVGRPRSTMMGGASVAVRGTEAFGGKDASLRVSTARSRGARKLWRVPRMTVMCGVSAVDGAAWVVAAGGGNAASFCGAAAGGAGREGFSAGRGGAERKRRGCGLADCSTVGGGTAATGGGSAQGRAIGEVSGAGTDVTGRSVRGTSGPGLIVVIP